ncbi:tektin-2-like [Paramacrobiotus metropolitanus]|uniref:tektin-2-like n=1 Tax=Paramacrobiotus metropolitanus TaxID=2943436 RepID=UPI002445CBEB|nr:tektin-2-like [Paramacrobiotus metropolitanus]
MLESRGYYPAEREQFDRNIDFASDDLRSKSLHDRFSAGWLRQEVGLRSKWDEHDTRMRLRDRVDHVEAVRARLLEARDLIEKDGQLVTEAKNGLDKGLTGRYDLIMNVNGECRKLCDARQGINNVHDDVEDQLRMEAELAAQIRRELNKKSLECSKLLEEFMHMKNQLEKDVSDKKQAMDIDQAQLGLTTASSGLSLKPDILRVPPAMVTMRVWLENSVENLRLSAKILDKAHQLRNDILALWSKVENEFAAKIYATDYAYRKRYNDTLLAARRLEHNRQNLADEIKANENDIEATETAWQNMIPHMQLAHTRIENRNQRPNYELALDPPHEGLVLEATNLAHSREALFNKLKELRSRWNDLTEQLHRVELDLERKTKCLEMDKRAMTLRETTFSPHAEKDVSDWITDRSSKVFAMDPEQRYRKHVPKILV